MHDARMRLRKQLACGAGCTEASPGKGKEEKRGRCGKAHLAREKK